ncbi:MAG: alpha/beta hydrolase [Caldilinea sp. CFX5]|nr:alpha/beta hydrolase [Caldilinea sp. CFX5]
MMTNTFRTFTSTMTKFRPKFRRSRLVDPLAPVAHRPPQTGSWLRKIVIGGLMLLVALSVLTWLAGAWAKRKLAQAYPPPGRLIDVGGYHLHLDCRGQGSPTVLLEAGLGDFSVQWALVQPAVAQFTRVCTYDRAGLGWSEPGPHPRTPATMVEELYTLLNKAGESAPYLLVGHSFGGITMRRFVQQYPATVVGLVFVDSAHEAQGARMPALRNAAAQVNQQFRLLSRLNAFGLLALAPTQIPNRGLPAEELAQYRARLATSAYFAAAIAESEAFYTPVENTAATTPTELGDLPLIVLSRGQAMPLPGLPVVENEALEQSWRVMQRELVALSSNSQQWLAASSGHDIQLQQPALVIAAIRQLVAQR